MKWFFNFLIIFTFMGVSHSSQGIFAMDDVEVVKQKSGWSCDKIFDEFTSEEISRIYAGIISVEQHLAYQNLQQDSHKKELLKGKIIDAINRLNDVACVDIPLSSITYLSKMDALKLQEESQKLKRHRTRLPNELANIYVSFSDQRGLDFYYNISKKGRPIFLSEN